MDMLLEQFKILFDRPGKVKKLRKLILQLAVRGKLVPQDESDEPAAVLLDRIREEKDKLIKEGKIKKENPLDKITVDEKPFDLPFGWEWVRIGDLITLKGGKRVPKGYELKTEPTNHVYIRITDMKNGAIKDYDLRYIDDNVYSQIKNYIITKDDLYITIAGTIGEVGIVPDRFDNMNLTENAARIIPYKVNRIWLKDFLSSNLVQVMLLDKVNQMAQPKLALKRIQDTLIPLPPLTEQHRIVEKLDSLMSFCDKLEKELERKIKYSSLSSKSVFNSIGGCTSGQELEETLRFIIENFKELTLGDGAVKELKNAILQLAVQGKLVPQNPSDEPASVLLEKIQAEKERLISEGKIKREKPLSEINEDEKPYELPEGWTWVRFVDIALIQSNLVNPTEFSESIHVAPDNIEKGTGKLLEYRTVKEDEVKSVNHYFYSGQILYSKIRPNLSKAVIVDFEGLCSADMYPIKSLILTKYLLLYILSYAFISQATNNDNRVKMPKINQEQLNNILVALPPLNEQHRIVEKVSSLLSLCDEIEKRIEKSKEYSEILTGAILKEEFKA